jgi:hypothetical protein
LSLPLVTFFAAPPIRPGAYSPDRASLDHRDDEPGATTWSRRH